MTLPYRCGQVCQLERSTGYCGICIDLAGEALCCTTVVSGPWCFKCCCQSRALTPDPAWASASAHTLVSSVATLHLLRSLLDLFCLSLAPALSICGWGCFYCESSVHIYHNFLGTNHVFYRLHFLYFNKNVNEKCPSGCLGSKTLKFGTKREVGCG